MKLKTNKGTQLRPLANGETLDVRTKGNEIIFESSTWDKIENPPKSADYHKGYYKGSIKGFLIGFSVANIYVVLYLIN